MLYSKINQFKSSLQYSQYDSPDTANTTVTTATIATFAPTTKIISKLDLINNLKSNYFTNLNFKTNPEIAHNENSQNETRYEINFLIKSKELSFELSSFRFIEKHEIESSNNDFAFNNSDFNNNKDTSILTTTKSNKGKKQENVRKETINRNKSINKNLSNFAGPSRRKKYKRTTTNNPINDNNNQMTNIPINDNNNQMTNIPINDNNNQMTNNPEIETNYNQVEQINQNQSDNSAENQSTDNTLDFETIKQKVWEITSKNNCSLESVYKILKEKKIYKQLNISIIFESFLFLASEHVI